MGTTQNIKLMAREKTYRGGVCLFVCTYTQKSSVSKMLLLCSPNACVAAPHANQKVFHLTKLTYTNEEKAQIKSELWPSTCMKYKRPQIILYQLY